MEEAIFSDDFSVHQKMVLKAVPIQLTVDLGQPSVLPASPSLTGHYMDVK